MARRARRRSAPPGLSHQASRRRRSCRVREASAVADAGGGTTDETNLSRFIGKNHWLKGRLALGGPAPLLSLSHAASASSRRWFGGGTGWLSCLFNYYIRRCGRCCGRCCDQLSACIILHLCDAELTRRGLLSAAVDMDGRTDAIQRLMVTHREIGFLAIIPSLSTLMTSNPDGSSPPILYRTLTRPRVFHPLSASREHVGSVRGPGDISGHGRRKRSPLDHMRRTFTFVDFSPP